ncbi:MAG: right-handed parallel beta-helix repeat-containing protein [Bacteroidales bacterium]
MRTKTLLLGTLALIISTCFSMNVNAQFGNRNFKNLKKEVTKKVNKEEQKPAQEQQSSQEEKVEEPAAKPQGKTIYVSPLGSNRNEGTKEAPYKNIDKAIKEANDYDKIFVAEGVYSGTFDVGFFEITKPLEIYGSYSNDFSKRNPAATPTIIRTKPKAASGKQTLIYIREAQDVVIDGITVDMGEQNNYDSKAPEGIETGYLTLTNTGGTEQRSAIRIVGNDVTIRNCTFVNISYCGVSVAQRMSMPGKILIDNNVFVNCAHTGIDASVLTGPGNRHEIEICNNTFAFTYGTTFLNDNLGNAIWMKRKADYNVHHNIFAYASDAAIRYLDTDEPTLKLDHNLFMGNRKNDIHTSIMNNRVFISVEEFEDVDFVTSLNGNKRLTQVLPLDKAYISEFINMAAEVSMEYDPNTDWNQVRSILGLPQQASGTAKISFFANRYPANETHKLFGAVEGFGAQLTFKK